MSQPSYPRHQMRSWLLRRQMPPSGSKSSLELSNIFNPNVRRLPNLFAERTTIEYHDVHPSQKQKWKTILGDQSLYQDETSKAMVVFRDGKETTIPTATPLPGF